MRFGVSADYRFVVDAVQGYRADRMALRQWQPIVHGLCRCTDPELEM